MDPGAAFVCSPVSSIYELRIQVARDGMPYSYVVYIRPD